MKNSRRQFIKTGLKAGAALSVAGPIVSACSSKPKESDPESGSKKLNILILGGTSFLGPHQIKYALDRGHSISTFTRGKSKATVHQELFTQVESLIGDRENDLEALKNKKWDAVIDNSGRNVEWTRKTAELLKDNVGMYLYTSSTGVYYPYLTDNIQESTELVREVPSDLPNDEMKMEYGYGVMKANSEEAAKEFFGQDRTIVVRPTYMVGPADKLDRFIYWPVRMSQGGETMIPGLKTDPVQLMDVRDVAEFMIRLIENRTAGTFNAVGPQNAMNMEQFANVSQSAFDVESSHVYIDDYEFLKGQGVHYIVPWIMPEANNYGSARVSNQAAIANGLTFRSMKQTVLDTYNWWNSDALTQERRDRFEKKEGSILLREQEILTAWKSREA